jgi:hypothetical protein
MKKASSETRYELKIPMEDVPLFHIRRWINLHPMAFREAFPIRQVNNIYFDTPDLVSFQDHLDGVHSRRKFRLRWYGSKVKFSQSQMEIKKKHGDLGEKEIFFIDELFDLNRQSWDEVQENLKAVLSPLLIEMISVCRPVLINHYTREYFESWDGAIRISLDYDHNTYDQRFSGFPNLCYGEPHHNVPLIEIKAGMHNYESVVRALTSLPRRAEPFSKYIDGMLSTMSR